MTSTLPKGWLNATISDITEYVQRGKSPKYCNLSDLPVVNQKCVRWSGVDLKHVKYVDPSQWSQWAPERYLQNGDILWNSTGTGTIGRAAIVEMSSIKKLVVDSHVTVVRPNNLCHPKYLFYFIRSPLVQNFIEDMQQGSTNQVELSRERVLNTVVPLAPYAEQERIVAKLETLCTKVIAVQDLVDSIPLLLKKFRQSVLLSAISGEMTADWRTSKQLGLESWRYDSAKAICSKVQSGKTPKEGFISDPGIPFLKVYNIVEQKVNFEYKPQFISSEIHNGPLSICKAFPGDVLMNIVGPPMGKVAIVPNSYPEWSLNQAITLFRPNEKMLSEWIYYFLCSGESIADIVHETRGSAGQTNISLTQCREFLFPVPTVEEQKELISRIKQLFDWADSVESMILIAQKKLKNFLPAILKQAFEGNLLPQFDLDEPIEVLLSSARGVEKKLTAEKKSKTLSKR